MIIGIDADEVLLRHVEPWLRRLHSHAGVRVPVETVTDWHFTSVLSAKQRRVLWKLRTPDIYEETTPMPWAQWGVAQLRRAGHRLVVVTHDTLPFVQTKAAAIRRYFGRLPVVFAKEKRAAVRFDLLIDDALHNEPDILLARPWNAEIPAGGRAMIHAQDWRGVVETVELLSTPGMRPWLPVFSGTHIR